MIIILFFFVFFIKKTLLCLDSALSIGYSLRNNQYIHITYVSRKTSS